MQNFDECRLVRISFNKVDGIVRVYDGTRYLVLPGGEKFDFFYNRIKYDIGVYYITYCFSHNYARIKVDLFDSLPLEKTKNVAIHIKSG